MKSMIGKQRQKTVMLVAVLGAVSLWCGGQAWALTYQDTTDQTFTINPTINVTVSGDILIDNLSPGSSSDSNIITVSASSNAYGGYELYSLVGNSDSSSSYHDYGTDLRLSSTDNSNKFTSITTNKASLAAFDPGTWGYTYSVDGGTNWISGNYGSAASGYNGLPLYNGSNTSSGVMLAETSNQSGTSSIKFRIGAKATNSQVSGNYTNAINFIGVGKVVTTTYNLTYNANAGSDNVTGMPSNVAGGTTTDDTITLSSTIPSRSGYTFKGWCNVATSDDTCSGIATQPGKLYAIHSGNTASNDPTSPVAVNMYAMWRKDKPTKIDDVQYLQDFYALTSDEKATILATMTEGASYELTDRRDDKTYNVAKLAGGKVWFRENLALDLTTVSLDNLKGTADAPNTNATDQTLTYLKNGGGSSPYTSTAVAHADSSNPYDTPKIAVSGTCNDAYCVNNPSNGNWTSEAITQATINGTTSVSQGKIGVYYNYCAASAGSYCYAGGAGTGNAAQDICPAGWRLPTGGSSGEYQALYTAYSSNYHTFQTALATPLSGYFYSGSAHYQGYLGYFWSSTIYDTSYMYFLDVYFTSVSPSRNSSRPSGYSVRCVLSN